MNTKTMNIVLGKIVFEKIYTSASNINHVILNLDYLPERNISEDNLDCMYSLDSDGELQIHDGT